MKCIILILLAVVFNILFSCKTSTEPENAYSGITETDAAGQFIGNIDTNDWTSASYQNIYFTKNFWISPAQGIYITTNELGYTEQQSVQIYNKGKSPIKINCQIDEPFICETDSLSIPGHTLGSIILKYTPEDTLNHMDSLYINLSTGDLFTSFVKVSYHAQPVLTIPTLPYIFYPAYPNPASGSIRFHFYLKEAKSVSLYIKDESGAIIESLLSESKLMAGRHIIHWSLSEGEVKPGTYRVFFKSGDLTTCGDIQVIE